MYFSQFFSKKAKKKNIIFCEKQQKNWNLVFTFMCLINALISVYPMDRTFYTISKFSKISHWPFVARKFWFDQIIILAPLWGGWRIGYIVLPKNMDTFMSILQSAASQTYSCAPAPMQHAIARARNFLIYLLKSKFRFICADPIWNFQHGLPIILIWKWSFVTKIVLVIKKNFWNSRPSASNFQNF